MEQMVFSEAEAGCRYIAYIAGALANARGVCAEICAADGRIYLRARGEGLAAAEKAACERAAEVLGISREKTERIATENTKRLFNKIK